MHCTAEVRENALPLGIIAQPTLCRDDKIRLGVAQFTLYPTRPPWGVVFNDKTGLAQ